MPETTEQLSLEERHRRLLQASADFVEARQMQYEAGNSRRKQREAGTKAYRASCEMERIFYVVGGKTPADLDREKAEAPR